jgi:mRNA interferase MazF
MSDFPQQGTIYLAKALKQAGDTKKRPVLVVSVDIRNRHASTVLVVPFSSDVAASAGNPCRILIPAGTGGLEKDSVTMGDLITTVQKSYLERGPYGNIDSKLLQQVLQGVQIAMGIYEEQRG